MSRMKVILNPTAGRGYGQRAEPELRRHLESLGAEFELVKTEERLHAIRLAEEAVADGFEMVVAAGGDGTFNEVVNGLMRSANGAATTTMGVIPVGSGSDFSYCVGVSPVLAEACRQLVHGEEKAIDVGKVTVPGKEPRYFDNTVGIGFDAIVTYEAQKVKFVRGMALYLPVVLKTVFLNNNYPVVTVVYDGESVTLPAMMVCVANGAREGGGFFVTPDAKPDDGLFDVCITRQIGRMETLKLIPQFMQGTHVDKEPVTMTRAKKVTVRSEQTFLVHMDGEVLSTDASELTLEIVPGKLTVRS